MSVKHYGTIVHWFDDMQRGSIMPDDADQRIFFDGHSLSPQYHSPKTGERVCFFLEQENTQPVAYDVELLELLRHNQQITITLNEWDLLQNGGFGKSEIDPHTPIFALGQFLLDQTTIPDAGDVLEGRVIKHDNGQWMLVDFDIIQKHVEPETTSQSIEAEEEKVTPTAPSPTKPSEHATEHHNMQLPPNNVISGKIVNWNDEKGYGFIRFGDESQNIFFHISAFHYTNLRPKNGQSVSFYCNRPIGEERQKAVKVVLKKDERFLSENVTPDYYHLNINYGKMFINSLIGIVFLLAVAKYSWKLAAFYLIVSVIAFFLYRSDKRIAQSRSKSTGVYIGRVPEKRLHTLGLIGGWPGALLARAAFNHKTVKTSFILIFWLTVAINIAITYALLIHYADNPISQLLKN